MSRCCGETNEDDAAEAMESDERRDERSELSVRPEGREGSDDCEGSPLLPDPSAASSSSIRAMAAATPSKTARSRSGRSKM